MFNPPTSYDVIPDYVKLEDFHKYPEDYVVRPPYQRKNVWTRKKKQALLDSLFRRYYVPKIVLREIKLAEKDKKNEVIDGQQRIRVAQEFYEDELTLPQSLADLDSSLPGRNTANYRSRHDGSSTRPAVRCRHGEGNRRPAEPRAPADGCRNLLASPAG